MIKSVYWSSCMEPVILVIFQLNLDFLKNFRKNTQISNFIKIRSVEAVLFHSGGRMDEMGKKLVVTFRNFTKAPKKKETWRVSRIWSRKPYYPKKNWKNGTKIISEFEQKGTSENKEISKALTL